MEKIDELIKAHDAVFGFEIIDGKIEPPKYNLPKAVNERVEYFGNQSEDGLSFLGCLNAIFAYNEEEIKREYLLGATEDWLPVSKEVRTWFDGMGAVGEMLITVKLLYGLRSTPID